MVNIFGDMNSGYSGYSMSNRAVEAYADGEMPLSKWTKDVIIRTVRRIVREDAIEPKFDISKLQKYSTAVLRRAFLTYSSWHHTGKFCNATDFYSVSKYYVINVTDEQLESIKADIRAENRAKKEKLDAEIPEVWLCEYLTWEGTRKHPKAEEHIGAGIVKGNWFIMNHEKKKVSANGFVMLKHGFIKNKKAKEWYVVAKWDYRKDQFVEWNAFQIKRENLVNVKFSGKSPEDSNEGYMLKSEVEKHPNIWIKDPYYNFYRHK